MGHYASEMMCDKCGRTRCVCPPEKIDRSRWVMPDGKTVEQFRKEKFDDVVRALRADATIPDYKKMVRTQVLADSVSMQIFLYAKAPGT